MAFLINDFEKSIDFSTLEKGRRYFKEQRVFDLTRTNEGAWTAYVEGAHDDYASRVAFDGDKVSKWHCTCSHDGEMGPCKHVVALLFELKRKGVFDVTETLVESADGVFEPKNKIFISQKDTAPIQKMIKKDYSSEGLYAAFQDLETSQQRAVKLAALICEPFSATRFHEIFNALFEHEGRSVSINHAKTFLVDINEAGFVMYLPTGQYRMPVTFLAKGANQRLLLMKMPPASSITSTAAFS